MQPVSKPDSMKEQVGKAYAELKDGINGGSLDHALSNLDKEMHDMTPQEWNRYSALLFAKVNTTAQMLPELSILATESVLSNNLDGGGTIDKSDVLRTIAAEQAQGRGDGHKIFVEEQLLQSFLDNDYETAKNESGGMWAKNASLDDMNKVLSEKMNANAALSLLEKDNAAAFKALADTNMNISLYSIADALKREANLSDEHLSMLSPEASDLAKKLVNDQKLFKTLSNNGDKISFKDLDDEALRENANVAVLRRATDSSDGTLDNKGDRKPVKTEPSPKPGNDDSAPDKHGKPGDGNSNARGTKSGGGPESKDGDTPGIKAHGGHKKPAEHQSYTVRRGDDLTHIARRRLIEEHIKPTQGKVNEMIAEIAANNGIANPDYIRDGQVLHF